MIDFHLLAFKMIFILLQVFFLFKNMVQFSLILIVLIVPFDAITFLLWLMNIVVVSFRV